MSSSKGEITLLLSKGVKSEDFTKLMPHIYPELRQLAAHYFRTERPGHTWQPTELVHEMFLRLFAKGPKKYANRAHFFGVVSRAMAQLLIEHARHRNALKRPGTWRRVALEEADGIAENLPDRLALEEAVSRLGDVDPDLRHLAQLRLFAGFSTPEAGAVLGRAPSTARRDWSIARTWLQRELERVSK
jgi:RNA polymerase sigma-70 factor (ECF subfamily)